MSEAMMPSCSICHDAVSECWGHHAQVPRYLRPELRALDELAREARVLKAVNHAEKLAQKRMGSVA